MQKPTKQHDDYKIINGLTYAQIDELALDSEADDLIAELAGEFDDDPAPEGDSWSRCNMPSDPC